MSDDFQVVVIAAPPDAGRAPAPFQVEHADVHAAHGPPSACVALPSKPEAYVAGNGPRPYFQYRDLGAQDVTDGRMHLHIVRATGTPSPEGGTNWHTHTMAQWYMVLEGEGNIDVKDHGRSQMHAGDCMTIARLMPHNEFKFSGDYEVMQLCTPGTYETTAV
jgi:mannose-6-phosphate isomerase-like protein (cupin superfamily)